jgi:hypothetical protein
LNHLYRFVEELESVVELAFVLWELLEVYNFLVCLHLYLLNNLHTAVEE